MMHNNASLAENKFGCLMQMHCKNTLKIRKKGFVNGHELMQVLMTK